MTIQIFGIMILKNVKAVLQLMFMEKNEENAFALIINLMILVYNVCNAYLQTIGIQIKEDVYNAPINKYSIVLKVIVLHVHKMPHYLKIMNALHVLKTLITIN